MMWIFSMKYWAKTSMRLDTFIKLHFSFCTQSVAAALLCRPTIIFPGFVTVICFVLQQLFWKTAFMFYFMQGRKVQFPCLLHTCSMPCLLKQELLFVWKAVFNHFFFCSFRLCSLSHNLRVPVDACAHDSMTAYFWVFLLQNYTYFFFFLNLAPGFQLNKKIRWM